MKIQSYQITVDNILGLSSQFSQGNENQKYSQTEGK